MSSPYLHAGIVCLLLVAIINPPVSSAACNYAKEKGYIAAYCSKSDLSSVPTNLRSEIEALYLSYNRIRELKNDSFKCCTSLKFLYLNQNIIYKMEAHVFEPLTELQVLDLSLNVIKKIPDFLPLSLRRLYLDSNPIFEDQQTNKTELKLASLRQLEYLSIGYIELKEFPSFGGVIPNLIELNVTGNQIKELGPDDLAPLCQLKMLHVTADYLFQSKEKLCDCLKLERWTSSREILVKTFTCKYSKTTPPTECNTTPSNATMASYNSCLVELKHRQIPFWLMVGGGILAAAICICVLLYVRYRRRQRQSKPGSRSGSRNPSIVKYENNKVSEANNERTEEDKLLKQ